MGWEVQAARLLEWLTGEARAGPGVWGRGSAKGPFGRPGCGGPPAAACCLIWRGEEEKIRKNRATFQNVQRKKEQYGIHIIVFYIAALLHYYDYCYYIIQPERPCKKVFLKASAFVDTLFQVNQNQAAHCKPREEKQLYGCGLDGSLFKPSSPKRHTCALFNRPPVSRSLAVVLEEEWPQSKVCSSPRGDE